MNEFGVNQHGGYTMIKRKIIFDVLDRFPDHGNQTLAKKVYKEHPLLWNNIESVRSIIRFYRGSSGENCRLKIKNKTYVRQSISTT